MISLVYRIEEAWGSPKAWFPKTFATNAHEARREAWIALKNRLRKFHTRVTVDIQMELYDQSALSDFNIIECINCGPLHGELSLSATMQGF